MSSQLSKRRHLVVASDAPIWLSSVVSGLLILGLAIFFQWLVYDDWLHETGPLPMAGSVLAGALMAVLVFKTLHSRREKKRELMARLQTLRWMNDRIRNSLQAIECVTYAAAPEATDEVRSAVHSIEEILGGFLAGHQRGDEPEPCAAAPIQVEISRETLTQDR